MVERIQANAELVVNVARNQLGEEVGYDEAGVRWLDGYIQRQHEQGDPADRPGLVSTLGSYLGECIIRSFGGKWAQETAHGACGSTPATPPTRSPRSASIWRAAARSRC
jgi:hypothetical protein